MADKLTSEELGAIKSQHQTACDLFGDGETSESHVREFHIAHRHRTALLRHVEALEREVEKLSNGYACPVCGGYPGPQDNCACGGSGHIADAYDYLRKDHIRLEQEVDRLRGEKFPQYSICSKHPYLTGTSPTASALGCPYCKLAQLQDPNEVHVAMLKGVIAPISWHQHCHLTGEVPNDPERHLSELVRAREEKQTAERKLARLVEAAKKVRHWHDTHDGGMVVSGESVRGLWEAIKEATGEGK